MSESKQVARLVAWANLGGMWRGMARDAGFVIDVATVGSATEFRLSRSDRVVALIVRHGTEHFGYVFVPAARHWRDRLHWLPGAR